MILMETQSATQTSRIMEISPTLAADWLERMGQNRTMVDHHVKRLAREMARGNWQLTGEAIKFDVDGRLIDGQHRLAAVIWSGATIQSWVTEDVPAAAFDVLDSGRTRTPADVLSIHGYHCTTCLSGACRAIVQYREKGFISKQSRNADALGNDELLALLAAEPEIIASADMVSNHTKLGIKRTSRAQMAALHYLFGRADPEARDRFFEQLATGHDLGRESPILHLREKLLANVTAPRPMTHQEIAALTIKAWKAFRRGEPVRRLTWRMTDLNPEPFPQIDGLVNGGRP